MLPRGGGGRCAGGAGGLRGRILQCPWDLERCPGEQAGPAAAGALASHNQWPSAPAAPAAAPGLNTSSMRVEEPSLSMSGVAVTRTGRGACCTGQAGRAQRRWRQVSWQDGKLATNQPAGIFPLMQNRPPSCYSCQLQPASQPVPATAEHPLTHLGALILEAGAAAGVHSQRLLHSLQLASVNRPSLQGR